MPNGGASMEPSRPYNYMSCMICLSPDDAFFQPELGWSVWGSLGWTKTADGLNWRDAGSFGLG